MVELQLIALFTSVACSCVLLLAQLTDIEWLKIDRFLLPNPMVTGSLPGITGAKYTKGSLHTVVARESMLHSPTVIVHWLLIWSKWC